MSSLREKEFQKVLRRMPEDIMLSWKVRLGERERERENEENDEECGKIQSRCAYPRDISS